MTVKATGPTGICTWRQPSRPSPATCLPAKCRAVVTGVSAALWRAVRRGARVLRAVHEEQVRMWECWWQASVGC
jgi:hypothetical protein